MSNQERVVMLIAQLGGSKNIIGVNQVFCRFMKGLEGGVFLAQLIFWSDKGGSGDGWFYKSYPEWYEETFITEYKIRDIRKKCEEMGFLETAVRKANGNPTVHYRLDMKKLVDLLAQFMDDSSEGGSGIVSLKSKKPNFEIEETESLKSKEGNLNFKDSLTENTTEITSKDNRRDVAAAQQPPTPKLSAKKKRPKMPEGADAPEKPSAHPLIQSYRDVFKRYPPADKIEAIIEANPDMQKWIRACREWRLRPYNPLNIKGLLDWAANPGLMENSGNGRSKPDTMRRDDQIPEEWYDENGNYTGGWTDEELAEANARRAQQLAELRAAGKL